MSRQRAKLWEPYNGEAAAGNCAALCLIVLYAECMRLTYSINEVADLLGCSRSKVYALMDGGHLFYIQPAGWRLIPAEALQAFTRGQKYDPNADADIAQHADLSTWPPTNSLLTEDGTK